MDCKEFKIRYKTLKTQRDNAWKQVIEVTPLGAAAVLLSTYMAPVSVAHELDHAVAGLKHHADDVNFPQYKTSYKPNLSLYSIGEFGYDPQMNKVFLPNERDYMPLHQNSGAGGWISPYNYLRLLNNFRNKLWSRPCESDSEEDPCF